MYWEWWDHGIGEILDQGLDHGGLGDGRIGGLQGPGSLGLLDQKILMHAHCLEIMPLGCAVYHVLGRDGIPVRRPALNQENPVSNPTAVVSNLWQV